MPRKRIGIIPYQPVHFHIIEPNAAELELGWREFAKAAYDQYVNTCFKYSPPFCQLAELDDTMHVQWRASDATNDLWDVDNLQGQSGTATSTTTDKLVDTGANFTGADDLFRIVVNTTTGEVARITTVDTNQQVSVSADIFTSGDAYQVWDIELTTNDFTFEDTTGELTLTGGGPATVTIGASSSLFPAPTAPNWGNIFRFEIPITQYNYGSGVFEVGTGGITYQIASAGDYELFFSYTAGQELTFTAGNNFYGTIDLGNVEQYGVNERYRLDVLDLNDNLLNFVDVNLTGLSSIFLQYGNGFYSNTWANLLSGTACQCVRLAISDWDDNNCGSFTELTDWTIENESISQDGDQICFTGTAKDGFAAVVFGDLPCGVSRFPLQVEFELEIVSYTSGGVNVSINNTIGGGASTSGSYSAVGTYTFTIGTPSPDGVDKQIQLNASVADTVMCVKLRYRLVGQQPDYFAKSDCFNVCETHECSLLIEYTNNEPAYGLIISETGVIPPLSTRVNGYLRDNAITDVNLVTFKTGGTTQVPSYFNGQRNATLAMAPMPPYMHLILSTALTMSKCLLDGMRIHRVSEYTPDFNEESELSKVDVDVTYRNQRYLRNSY